MEKFVKRIDNGERLSEREIWEFIDAEYKRFEGEDRRWQKTITSIVKVSERLFSVDWEQGLTEMQDNEYPNQPIEVEEVAEEKVIIEYTYKPIKK